VKLCAESRLSVSLPLYTRLCAQFGQLKAEKVCNVFNERVEKISLRVNPLRISREALLKRLLSQKIPAAFSAFSDVGLVVGEMCRLSEKLPDEFKAGMFEIQDESSQIKAAQLKVRPGDTVLELGAGNGGNALVYAVNMKNKGHVYLYDTTYANPLITGRVKKRLRHAKISNFTLLAEKDLFQPLPSHSLLRKCDWVLIEAPSTGSAVYRKSPERKWAFSEEKLRDYVQMQRDLFSQGLSFVKRTGLIVYATESIFTEENTAQVEYFCQKHNLRLTKEPMLILPQSNGMNGLFVAILQRTT
jgi:16S rRNA C967 or C1407 C5-methylase (RsmB/RsmF family)